MSPPQPAAQLQPRDPYFVWFHTDRVPSTVDHSRPSPGPSGSVGNRAGYTSATQRARLTFAWDNGAPRSDGMVAFYAQSVNVYFWLDDFAVAISSDYPVGSCPYRVTYRHEFDEHVYSPIRIFLSYRNILVSRLNAIEVPTRRSPRWIRPADIPAFQEALERRVVQAVGAVKRELVRALEADRRRADSPSNYRLVYQQCSDEDWLRGRGTSR